MYSGEPSYSDEPSKEQMYLPYSLDPQPIILPINVPRDVLFQSREGSREPLSLKMPCAGVTPTQTVICLETSSGS
jgi:hypothetical protein